MSTPVIKWTGYLVIGVIKPKLRYSSQIAGPSAWKPSARLTVNKPAIGKDEVPVKIEVVLPASLFQQPTIEARITVPEGSSAPLAIDMQVQDNIADIIRQQTGFDVRVVAEQPAD